MVNGFVYITLQGKWFLFFLLSVLFILLTYFFYKYTIPPITFYKKLILSLLRSIALVLLILLLYEPILSVVKFLKERPKIGVVIDNTQSLLVSATSRNQIQKLKEFFKTKKLEEKFPEISFDYYSFKNQGVKYNKFSFDSLNFDGELTNISSALHTVKNENYSSLVLITDGNFNSGRNPIYEVEELNIPIFVIGVGDTVQQRDIMISKVQTNNIVYAGSKVPVEVTLKWFGFEGENAELIFSEDKKIISRTIIRLDEGEIEKRIILNYDAINVGINKLNLSVSVLKDELTEKNNYKDFYIEVLKSKLKVLIIAGAPSSDVSIVFNTLSENFNYSVMSFIQKNSDEFYPFYKNGKYEIKFSDAIIDTSDCIVLVNYPTQITKINTITKIFSKIQEKKIPVFIVLGKNVDYSKLQNLDPILPFNWQSANSREMFVFPALNEKVASSILLTKDLTKESYQQLPPIYKHSTQYRAKPESYVIAYVKDLSVQLNEPIFINRNVNRQKSFAILGYGIWRWKLLTQGSINEKFLYNFLTNIINWLTVIEDKQKIRVTPVKQNFTTADPIEFTAEIYNEQYQPIDDANLKVFIKSKDINYELLMNGIGNGRYEGSIDNLKAGDYSYSANVEVNGVNIGEVKGRFSVGNINIEYLDTRMNIHLLKKIGLQSGGKYFDVDLIDKLIDELSSVKVQTAERKIVNEYKLWTEEAIAGIVIIIFIIEWFIRKRNGLL